jgi:hypothetical protein
LHVTIEPNVTPPSSDPFSRSAIENEIPAYRAVSPGAVTALILGVLAILSFVSWYFLPIAVLAVVVGFLADRKIQKLPDVFTGRGIAQAGLGLGLIFGLTSVAINTVQSAINTKNATAFAHTFEQVLAKGKFEEAIWWTQPPEARAKQTPEKLVAEMTATPQNAQMFEQKNGPLRLLKKRLEQPGSALHFERLEATGVDGLNPYAAALYEVHSKPDEAEKKDAKETEEFALVYFKALKNKKGATEWWVEDFSFPAKPGGFVAPTKKVDDGHGHAH